jgi:hypothetical protein
MQGAHMVLQDVGSGQARRQEGSGIHRDDGVRDGSNSNDEYDADDVECDGSNGEWRPRKQLDEDGVELWREKKDEHRAKMRVLKLVENGQPLAKFGGRCAGRFTVTEAGALARNVQWYYVWSRKVRQTPNNILLGLACSSFLLHALTARHLSCQFLDLAVSL